MVSRLWSCAGLPVLFLLAGCQWLDRPDPRDYQFHGHSLIVHTVMIDSSAGRSGWPRGFRVSLHDCEYRRPGPGFCNYGVYSDDPYVRIDSVADPDTVDTFGFAHYVGLVQHLGGDTTHFARVDSLPGWEWHYRVSVYANEGNGWDEVDGFLLTLPDTVTPEVHLRVEATWPLLYEYDSGGGLHINLDYLHITRLDAH